jgi:hypothetical protein
VAGTEERPLTCAQCGRKPRDNESADDEWRVYREVDDQLPVFCPRGAGVR